MNGSELSKVSHEKDLGVTVSKDLKPNKHCSDIKTVNKLVSFIRTFGYKSEKSYPYILNVFVRPHLEHCIQVWSPYY